MLSLTAKAIHLDGRHSDVSGRFGAAGGSIGRDPKCDMVLPDPDRRVSRLQARIIYTAGQYIVCNASTFNPMYVNGVELSPGSSQAIARGDELRAGSYVIAVAELITDVEPALNDTSAGKTSFETQQTGMPAQTKPANWGSAVDPLRVLGSDGRQASVGASPFADLLSEETSSRGDIGAQPGLEGASPSSPATGGAVFGSPLEETGGQALTARDQSQGPFKAHRSGASPVMERQPSEIPENFTVEAQPNSLAGTIPPATGGSDSFGDILAQSLPAAGLAAVSSLSVNAPLQSRHNLDSDDASPRDSRSPGRTRDALPAADEQAQTPILADAPQTWDGDARSPSPPEPAWAKPLSALAGDPFADLMGPPVESQIARAPASSNVSQRMTYIPQDFNPLAAGGVAQRNTSDPLTPLGRNIQGLTDVTPERTIDSIYAPGTESPSTLVVDPLHEARERAMRVDQSVDPMKLFSSNSDGRGLNALMNENNQASNTKSVFNHASEMAAFFYAPMARPDPAIRAQLASDVMSQVHAQPSADPQQQISVPETDPIVPTVVYPPERGTDDLPPSPSGPLEPAAFAGDSPMPVDQALPADMAQNMSDAAELSSEETPSELLLPANAAPPAMKQFTDDKTASAENAENLMAAFKRGAELRDLPERSMTPELMETIGRLLQTAVQGTVSLLATRATVKQEIHLSVTLINPKANNPMKFLPDAETALLQMLGPRIPGFMAPVDAMEEAFDDLMTHQTAIAAGTQAAIEALFRRFDPDTIESQNPQSSVSEKISHALYDARLWNAYKNQYRQISIEVKDDFFRRLGADFHEAYNREYERNTSSKK